MRLPRLHDGPCPPFGMTPRARCLGICSECGEHLWRTSLGTVYCPECDVCPECLCPHVDGFRHYAGCPRIEEEEYA